MGDIVPAELTQVDRGRIQAAGGEFDPEVVYLNTATLGLPPRCCLTAVQAALREWQVGRANPADYDAPLDAARRAYAGLVNVEVVPGSVEVETAVLPPRPLPLAACGV